jgi:ribonuclease PH
VTFYLGEKFDSIILGEPMNNLRPFSIQKNVLKHPIASVQVSMGDTVVLCSVTIEDKVPPFLRGLGKGWITAEYGMLPAATHERTTREAKRGQQNGRTQEIQRLIGRSLRAGIDLVKLGERSIIVDCDVIQADGGTRCASITGGFIALEMAIAQLMLEGKLSESPIVERIAAVSVGILNDEVVLDLDFAADSACSVDMNVVMTQSGRFVEIQASGEEATFTPQQLQAMLAVAASGIQSLFDEA